MTIRAKLTAALAGSTSQTPIDTATLAQGHSMCSVKAALMELYRERQVCCYEYFKGNNKPVVKWWLAGVLPPPHSSQIKSGNRKRREAKRINEADDE